MAALLCFLYLLAFLGGSNAAWPLEGAASRKEGRNLLQGDTGTTPASGCGAGTCADLLVPGCNFIEYPSRPGSSSCRTTGTFTVTVKNCFVDRSLLAYVAVVAPAATGECTRYGPSATGGEVDYLNSTAIVDVQLKCGQAVLIFAKGTPSTSSASGSTVTGTQKNPPAGCRAPGTAKKCDTCRFRYELPACDTLVANKQVCRARRDGVCENDAVCSNTDPLCPATNPLKTDTSFVCRTAVNTPEKNGCEKNTFCDGKTTACPPSFDTGSICRDTQGFCDPPEVCDGTGAQCPPDKKYGTEKTCRAAVDKCDVAETCDGDSPACPDNKFQDVGTPCADSTGVCDLASTCDASHVCQAKFKPNTERCGASTGACVKDSYCNGTPDCPPLQRYQASDNQVCRASKGVCDAEELCTGNSDDCGDDFCVNKPTVIPDGGYDTPTQTTAKTATFSKQQMLG